MRFLSCFCLTVFMGSMVAAADPTPQPPVPPPGKDTQHCYSVDVQCGADDSVVVTGYGYGDTAEEAKQCAFANACKWLELEIGECENCVLIPESEQELELELCWDGCEEVTAQAKGGPKKLRGPWVVKCVCRCCNGKKRIDFATGDTYCQAYWRALRSCRKKAQSCGGAVWCCIQVLQRPERCCR